MRDLPDAMAHSEAVSVGRLNLTTVSCINNYTVLLIYWLVIKDLPDATVHSEAVSVGRLNLTIVSCIIVRTEIQ